MGDPLEACPAGLSEPGCVVGPRGAPFECTEQVSLTGRKLAQMNRELPSQLRNREMEGQCQSSDVAGKTERLKERRAAVSTLAAKGRLGRIWPHSSVWQGKQ